MAWIIISDRKVEELLRLFKNAVGDIAGLSALGAIREAIEHMSAQLDRVREEVEETKTVALSVKTLLTQLAQLIRDLKEDPAALDQLANDLDAENKSLQQAVVDNTPSVP